ncbi:MAG: transglutaminase-like domain-containing protein [Candidatus Krumholzibacteriia bacterium]
MAAACVAALVALAGPDAGTGHAGDDHGTSAPGVVTEDIQAGIETYIEEQVRRGGGHFALDHGDVTLQLNLVRVHTEYLANLGPNSHFACVDLVDVSGDVYDVDFFLTGEPGAMTVSETTVHKINGQPYYAWDQADDGTWRRIPVDEATAAHLGVIHDSDAFEFTYRATLPPLDAPARMWLPLPETDAFQTVEILSIEAPGEQRMIRDRDPGNRVLFLELGPEDGGEVVEIRYRVQRREVAAYEAAESSPDRYLHPERMVPATEDFEAIAREVVAGKEQDLVRARALYDHVIDRMAYIKHGDGWGRGDAVYACDVQSGNCTDFHSYFVALARAAGIPARFAIGAALPSERDEGGVDGYHCWAEFHADGKWWPVDISEADKYSGLATYYFGHHPANRFEFSRGRDLVVDPLPASGPINFLAYPVLEVDGRPATAKVEFTFRRIAQNGRTSG